MMHKVEVRQNKPRDGRHCDLCGCSQPAVRCDKCGCQIFCLSCDDMYHRHPKRRFHLRKAVDPAPATSQARPVLPMKVAHMATSPGDPSKMPLPPPRKKKPGKSFFDTFRRPSPSSDNSPPLPKKEYSWTDRLGSIKKFMSNRPLPPLPANDAEENNVQLTGVTQKHDLSFIHKRVDEKPPQLPQRSYKPESFGGIEEKENQRQHHGENGMDVRNGSIHGPPIHRNGGFSSSEDGHWSNRRNENQFPRQLNTLDNRQNHPGFMQQSGQGYPPNFNQPMHQSISSTDLQSLPGMDGHPSIKPQYPHYPMNAPMPPHYPYPMYPQYPNYPPYFGNSFANLSSQPNTENDFSDNSEASSRHHGSRRYPFRKKAKRSQSVMVDRMGYPGQYYPFGPYPPGYAPPPWGQPFPMDAPPSPASSIRSLNRVGRTRRRKKMTSEDDDEEFSVSSSPLSRPKSSSSERPTQGFRKAPPPPQSSSSDESENEREINKTKGSRTARRDSDPRRLPSPATKSPQVIKKKTSKLRKSSLSGHSDVDDSEPKLSRTEIQHTKEIVSGPTPPPGHSSSIETSSDNWQCRHCTYINSPQNKICQVCCKTASPVEDITTASSRPTSASSRKQSLSSEKSCSSPEKRIEDDVSDLKAKQDMDNLNSALDEAEKEISRGIEELMKLKEDFSSQHTSPQKKDPTPSQKPPVVKESGENSKPVYKSSGKMRTRMLDKLNLNLEPATKSASTETQTGNSPVGSYDSTDKIIEARRPSTSSTTSDAYNSPIAQSPDLEQTAMKKDQVKKLGSQKDSSCQTQQENAMDYPDRRSMEDEPYFGRQMNGFGYRYGERMDMVTSPVPSMYDREFGRMPRSRSRASLFTGRINDPGPMEFGMGPSPMYRSVSRTSLTGDFTDNRFSEFHNLRKPDYYLSMEELVERRRQEHIRAQGLELVRMIREAEQQGFTADDIQIALSKSGNQNPLEWLQQNWKNMVENVVNMSTNYGNEKKENDVGAVSEDEARDALRLHKGNIWAAVTECVESRQRKFFELKARGKFSSKAIIEALTATQGDVGLAYTKLTKSSSKPFLMRIWGAGEGAENQDGAIIPMGRSPFQSEEDLYRKQGSHEYEVLSDDIWSEDEDVDWEEDADDDDEHEQGDLDDLHTCREDLPNDIITPESDKSDYADAFGTNTLERVPSLPSEEEVFPVPDEQKEKRRSSLLSKLAGLRKDGGKTNSKTVQEDESQVNDNQEDQAKAYTPLNIIKNTISAIRDTVSGPPKPEKKLPCAAPERRTIIVNSQISPKNETETLPEASSITNLEKKHNLLVQNRQIDTNLQNERGDESDFNVKPEMRKKSDEDSSHFKTGEKSEKPIASPESNSGMKETNLSVTTENSITEVNHFDEKLDTIPAVEDAETKSKDVTVTSSVQGKKPFVNISEINKEVKQKSHQDSKVTGKELIPEETPMLSNMASTATTEKPRCEREIIKDNSHSVVSKMTTKTGNSENGTKIDANRKETLDKISPSETTNTENKAINLSIQNNSAHSNIIENTTNEKQTIDNITSSSILSREKDSNHSTFNKNTLVEKNKTQQNDNEILNLSMPKKVASTQNSDLNKVESSNGSSVASENVKTITTVKETENIKNNAIPVEKVYNNHVPAPNLDKSNEFAAGELATFNLAIKSAEYKNELHAFNEPSENKEVLISSGCDFKAVDSIGIVKTPNVNKNVSETSNSEISDKTEISKEMESLKFIDSTEVVEEMATVKIFQKKKFQPEEDTQIHVKMDNLNSKNIDSVREKESKDFHLNSELTDPIGREKEFREISSKLDSETTETITKTLSSSDEQNGTVKGQTLLSEMVGESSTKTFEKSENENDEKEIKFLSSRKNVELSSAHETIFSKSELLHGSTSDEKSKSSSACNNTNITNQTNSVTDAKPINENKVKEPTNREDIKELEQITENIQKTKNTVSEVFNSDNAETRTTFLSQVELKKKAEHESRLEELKEYIREHDKATGSIDTNMLNNQGVLTSTSGGSFKRQLDEKLNNTESLEYNETAPSTDSKTAVEKSDKFKDKSETTDTVVGTVPQLSSTMKGVENSHSEIPEIPAPISSKQTILTTIVQRNNNDSDNQNIPKQEIESSSLTAIPTSAQNAELGLDTIHTEQTLSDNKTPSVPSTSKNNSSVESEFSFSPSKDQTNAGVSQQEEPKKKHGILKKTPSTENPNPNKVSFSSTDIKFHVESDGDSAKHNRSEIKHSSSSDGSSNEGQDVSDSSDQEDNSSSTDLSSTTGNRRSSIDFLRSRFEGLMENGATAGPVVRPQSPFRRMSFNSRKAAIALERTKETTTDKPWVQPRPRTEPAKPVTKRTLKQQLEVERKVRKMVADRKCRTYKKAEIVVQLMEMNFEEEEAIQAANECSTLEQAISYLQQECLLCTGYFPVSQIISMIHCPHMACRECIRAYFTVQIRDRNIMELLCPFCNEPDLTDEDIAQDYFNHLDIMLKKLVDEEIHELFQRKLRDRVLMRDPSFRWCSKCSSGFLAMPNLRMLVCPDCNAVTCASCRRPWEKEHQGISCEAFAALKGAEDPEAQALGLAKLLTEDGISCPRCHFRYALAKGGCMHFRCIQCQHDFCSGCSKPFKMGQKCGVSEFCAKLGLHAHHPRNCLFYLRDKDPEDLQRLLGLSEVEYDTEPPDGMESNKTCQVMEQKETADGMVDDYCGKEVEAGFAGLCRLHYVEYLGQLVNKYRVDPIQIFEKDDLELVLRRANVRLPAKKFRETDDKYRERLVNLIQEELPLDKIEGS